MTGRAGREPDHGSACASRRACLPESLRSWPVSGPARTRPACQVSPVPVRDQSQRFPFNAD
jgi:hypothetical protein